MSDLLRPENPEGGVGCYFCNGEGCFCPKGRHSLLSRIPGRILKTDLEVEADRALECVTCDICEGTGLISRKSVDQMVRHYRDEDQFKKAWKSSG